MFERDFSLPDRPIKIDQSAVSRPSGTLFGAVIIAALLAFLAIWQTPSLLRDAQIRNNPVIVADGDVRDGECTTRQGIFVDCSASLSYNYEGQHYDSDVKLFFVDFHHGDYTGDLVISGDKPELATISIAIEKFWNRVILLAVFLLGFAALVLGALRNAARIRAVRRQLAEPGRLTLLPVEVEAQGSAWGKAQFGYQAEGSKTAASTLFEKGTEPLILWNADGVPQGFAVRHAGADLPVLLDKGLMRLDLSADERTRLLGVIAAAEAAHPAPKAPGKLRGALAGALRWLWRAILLVLVVVAAVLGWWLYYVLASTNSHDPIGMDINNMMPEAVNIWACGKLELRFGDQNAPYGCTAADYQSWK